MMAPQRILDFYLDASFHVALAVFALVGVTTISLNIPTDFHLGWFLFFGTIVCYNFMKYGVEAEKYIVVADPHQRHFQWVSLVAFLLSLYHAFFLSPEVYMAIAILVLLTGLYAIPVLPRTKNLRSLGGLKIFVVAMVWAGATVILPVLAVEMPLTVEVYITTSQRFLFVLILLLPFEVRDLAYDGPELRTFPQRFGVANTKNIGVFASLLFYSVTFLKNSVTTTEAIANAIVLIVLIGLLKGTTRDQHRYFASLLVESVPMLWWGILLLISHLVAKTV
ncbi:MAG: hypothetical protein WA913_00630 [Pricia sp.]